jgi:hypothetical protein
VLPSAKLGFLNVKTDGRKKTRHNQEILFILDLLLTAGIKDYCVHHVDEAGMNKALPLTLAGKWYDISYVAPDGEIFLIEVMRLRKCFNSSIDDKDQPCQK